MVCIPETQTRYNTTPTLRLEAPRFFLDSGTRPGRRDAEEPDRERRHARQEEQRKRRHCAGCPRRLRNAAPRRDRIQEEGIPARKNAARGSARRRFGGRGGAPKPPGLAICAVLWSITSIAPGGLSLPASFGQIVADADGADAVEKLISERYKKMRMLGQVTASAPSLLSFACRGEDRPPDLISGPGFLRHRMGSRPCRPPGSRPVCSEDHGERSWQRRGIPKHRRGHGGRGLLPEASSPSVHRRVHRGSGEPFGLLPCAGKPL